MQEFVELVRRYLRDFPKLNELRGIMESTDQDIRMNILLAIDDYNTTPPIFATQIATVEEFPSVQLLLLGTICHLLASVGILQFRNSLSYSDGGVNYAVWDKGPAYIGNAQYFTQMWEMKKKQIKRQINVRRGWGGIPSADFSIYAFTTAAYAGDFFGAPGDAAMALAASTVPVNKLPNRKRTEFCPFSIDQWSPEANGSGMYIIPFIHNLGFQNVGVILTDPDTGEDLGRYISVFKLPDEKTVVMKVPANERRKGAIQCFVP